MYQQFCVGCHGPVGDGRGTAANFLRPKPLNFTALRSVITSYSIHYTKLYDFLQLAQTCLQLLAALKCIFEHVFLTHGLDGSDRRRAGDRVAAISAAV